ncbi:MAG: CRISPR-associated helicase Cas3', partial [Nitrospirae bacterium YQR-1]
YIFLPNMPFLLCFQTLRRFDTRNFRFKITGLLHDLGKYQPEFQNYLSNGGKRGSVAHASWGAGYSRLLGFTEASVAIDGHHKGLPDNSTWKSDTDPFKHHDVFNFDNIKQIFLNDIGINEADIKMTNSFDFKSGSSNQELFIRYLFSALTDSDWLSTEKHFDKDTFNMRLKTSLPIEEMIFNLESEFAKKGKDSEINQLRNSARNLVIQKAKMSCGFYSLALPTGMGKTLTSIEWALRHAKKNSLKRIIIVLPYVNIIDQTAHVLKNIFGEQWILEHHSSYNENTLSAKDKAEYYSLELERKKLACENWDYPIIVTTTVQFFESLFSNRPSQCRKIHSIAESVVIFDEVQSLPKEVILPTLRMLEDVHVVMKTSFLFCTATQPAFLKRQRFDGITSICPLIDNPEILYEKSKRVEYLLVNDLKPIDYDRLLEAVTQTGTAALIIFNTKKAALEFYQCTNNLLDWEKKYHLSTAMCPKHRKAVIGNIRKDIDPEHGRKILVVSTQLIEAGVDFDFPVVFRAMAPLESVIQAAGRCNREGTLGEMGGKVFLFKLQDSGMPDKTYAACAGHAEELIKQNINRLHCYDVFNKYYAEVVELYVDPDKHKINEARKRFDFETVSGAYRIINDVTEGLFIYHYSDESKQLLHSLDHKKFLSRDDYREMQTFTVAVYNQFLSRNKSMFKVMPQGFKVWYGNYDSETGISVAPIEADKLIV